ncbi:MAG: SpoVR family protein, partial [Deltaproteobacteria bacterium]|nr:SpoVR family protein [Deltaproteobacteria bacterium]
WGKPVKLETSVVASQPGPQPDASAAGISSLMPGAKGMPEIVWRRVVYTMDNRKLSKSEI